MLAAYAGFAADPFLIGWVKVFAASDQSVQNNKLYKLHMMKNCNPSVLFIILFLDKTKNKYIKSGTHCFSLCWLSVIEWNVCGSFFYKWHNKLVETSTYISLEIFYLFTPSSVTKVTNFLNSIVSFIADYAQVSWGKTTLNHLT